MHTPFLSTRAPSIRAAIVISQVLIISTVVACGDDRDRGTAPTSPASPASALVAFAKNTDKGVTRRIAFIGPVKKLHTMRPDGTDLVQLPGANAIEDDDPAWSPDYQRIAFVSNRSGGISNLHIVNADMTGLVTLTTGMYVRSPAFSADGRKIAFQYSAGAANWDIWVKDLDTGTLTQLTTNPSQETDPHFSPDGTRLVFTSNRDGHAEAYVMNVDGSNQQRVTYCGTDCSKPKWSPDGSRITFTGTPFGQSVFVTAATDMYRYLAVTPARTEAVGYFQQSSWSPDGKKLVFEGFVNGLKQIFSVNADGTGLVSLTPGFVATAPAWQW